MLESVIARAATFHPVTVCHFVVMANHIHLMLVVKDPAEVFRFVEYIKKESSHALNSMMGTTGINLWKKGYDSPIILDPEKAIERIIYFYTNPQKANLVQSIDDYPNLNSWKFFLEGGGTIESHRIPRIAYPLVPEGELSPRQEYRIKEHIEEYLGEKYHLTIQPDAWMACFEELRDSSPEDINQQIIVGVRDFELKRQEIRAKNSSQVLGVKLLCSQEIRKVYRPKSFGKRMVCLGKRLARRVSYIQWFSDKCNQAYDCFLRFKAGESRLEYPPGFFAPAGALLANISPVLRRELLLV